MPSSNMHEACQNAVCIVSALCLSDHQWSIIGCSYLDLRRQRRKIRVVQVLDTRIEPHAHAEFNCASNVQICIVCMDHPSFKRPTFVTTVVEWRWVQGQRHYDKMEQRSQELDLDMHIL